MRRIKKLLLLLIPLFAISCSPSQTSPQEEEIVVTVGETYKTNYWDKKIQKMIEYTCKEKSNTIPAFVSNGGYEAVVGYITVEEESLLCTQVKCFGVSSSSSNKLYGEKMVENGFILSSQGNYGYLMVDYSSDLFLSYSLVSDETNPYFIIQAFVRETREKEWNERLVYLFSEIEIPVCPAESYNTSYDQYYNRLIIYANFVSATSANDYVSTLRTKQFTASATDSSGAVQLVDSTGYVDIVVYQTYGDYDCHAVYIAISNAWPSIQIMSFTDLVLFPRLTDSDTAVYDDWDYFDPVGLNRDSDYTIRIFYKNASSTDYSNYLDKLVRYGLTKGETTTSESGIVSTYLAVIRPSDRYTVEVGLLYQISSSTICVVIYQAYKA